MEQVSGQRRLLTKDRQKGQVERQGDSLGEAPAFATRPKAQPDVRTRRDQVFGDRTRTRQITDARPCEKDNHVNRLRKGFKYLVVRAREIDYDQVRRAAEGNEHLAEDLGCGADVTCAVEREHSNPVNGR